MNSIHSRIIPAMPRYLLSLKQQNIDLKGEIEKLQKVYAENGYDKFKWSGHMGDDNSGSSGTGVDGAQSVLRGIYNSQHDGLQDVTVDDFLTAIALAGILKSIGAAALRASLTRVVPAGMKLDAAAVAKAVPKSTKLGLNELHGNWKLGLPVGPLREAALKQISSLKDKFLNHATKPGKFILKRSEAPVDAAGRRVYGKYNSSNNTIELYKDADLSTMTHELLHFDQAVKGNRIGRNLVDNIAQRVPIERDIELKLRKMGFVQKEGQP
jgi:hypothetical protein